MSEAQADSETRFIARSPRGGEDKEKETVQSLTRKVAFCVIFNFHVQKKCIFHELKSFHEGNNSAVVWV